MLKDSLVDSYCCFVITMCWVKFEIHFCLEIGNFSRFVLTPSPLNPSSTNPTTWSNILKQFVSNLPTNCLSVFHHFVKLALKGLRYYAPFKVRKFESLFYKINTCLQKNYHLHLIVGRTNILGKYIIYIFLNFGCGFYSSFPMLFPKAPACCKKTLN